MAPLHPLFYVGMRHTVHVLGIQYVSQGGACPDASNPCYGSPSALMLTYLNPCAPN